MELACSYSCLDPSLGWTRSETALSDVTTFFFTAKTNTKTAKIRSDLNLCCGVAD
jgi:hypothetical protein